MGASPLIVHAPWITRVAVSEARGCDRGEEGVTRVPSLRLDILIERQAVQILHVGPCRKSTRRSSNCRPSSRSVSSCPGQKHHEIFLQRSDPDLA